MYYPLMRVRQLDEGGRAIDSIAVVHFRTGQRK
jgi:hypothetical protein